MIPTSGVQAHGPSRRRAAFSYRGLLVALAVVAAVPAIAWSLRPEFPWSSKASGPMLHRVQRKDFIHEVTERGTVQSASNVEVRCMVKSRNMSGTQILSIVPEGTYVTPVPDWQPKDPDNPEDPPDLLVKLDSSALELDLTQQQIVCANSEASVIQAQNQFEIAKISKEEYLNGTYKKDKLAFEAAVVVAEEDLARAQEYLEYSELLYSKGYISDRELQANAFDVEEYTLELGKAKTNLEVLENYTKPKMLLQLNADIKTAEAKFKAAEHSYQLDQEELEEIKTQIANCTIRAPEPGQVVYANITDRRGGSEVIIEEGVPVRERQVIIKLPDPKRMQVEAKVNEAKITLVKPELPATIRLDAFPDLELQGKVERVNKYPAPSSWFMANVKEYEAFIRIENGAGGGQQEEDGGSEDADEPLAELRPGMTAEVKIRVEEIPDVLQVPVQALIEHGSRHYCVVPDGEGYRAREVEIGSSNDKVVVIREGLEEGEQVVLNAAAYRREVDLPELPAETVLAMDRRGRSPGEGAEGETASGQAAGGDRVSQMISRLDANGNGQLELDELPPAMRSVAAQADANDDNVLDRQELAAAVARMSADGPPGDRLEGPGGPEGRGPGAGNRERRGPGLGGRRGEGPAARGRGAGQPGARP